MPRIAEKQRRAAIVQQLGELIGVESGVERDDGASCRNDAEKGHHPSRVIIGNNCQPRSASESTLADPSCDRLGLLAELGVGQAIVIVVIIIALAVAIAVFMLNFERDVIGPPLGALDKTVIECGHGSRRIYTKGTSWYLTSLSATAAPNYARLTKECWARIPVL